MRLQKSAVGVSPFLGPSQDCKWEQVNPKAITADELYGTIEKADPAGAGDPQPTLAASAVVRSGGMEGRRGLRDHAEHEQGPESARHVRLGPPCAVPLRCCRR